MRLLGAGVVAVAIVACTAEEEPGPRFANDPQSVTEPTETPPPTAGAESVRPPTSAPASPVDAATLLRSRGAPNRLYFHSGSELWMVDPEEARAARVLRPDPGETLIASAVSPSGDLAAALLAADGSSTVVVVDPTGRVLSRRDDLAAGLPSSEAAVPDGLNWSPQGDRLLVSFETGGIVAMPVDGGDSSPLIGADGAPSPAGATWSPTGEAVAYLSPSDAAQPADLYLVNTAGDASPPTKLVAAGEAGRTVRSLVWLPNGRDLLYTLDGAPGAAVVSGDLWQIGTDGNNRRVVATAGSAVPVGRIERVAPATDGETVVYTVIVPGEGGDRFHSLWVRSLGAQVGPPLQLRVPVGEAVTDLWWSSAGLVFRTVPGDAVDAPPGTNFALYLASDGGTPTLLHRGGPTVDASPEPAPTNNAATPVP